MNNIIGRINPEDKNVTIWGAGFSGLVMGYFLKKQGYKVILYEKSSRAGGKIKTKKTPYGIAETGANALYLNEDSLELLKELKLEPIQASKKLKKLLLLNGKPKRAFHLSVLSKLALNAHKKPPLISDGLTVAEFFRPLLGTEIINRYLSPALGGIYAAPSDSLHFKSIFESAADKAQFHSYWEFIRLLMKNKRSEIKLEVSGSVSFEGGMQELINKLSEALKSEIKYNYKENFRIKGNTIICTDALSASDLLKTVRPEVSTELKRIRYQELSSITVFLKREIKSLQRSFGVLVPLGSNFNSIGIINNKAVFPINNSNVFSYTFIGRRQLNESQIKEDIKFLNSDFVPEDIEHLENTHWEKAIPIYDLQRFLSVKKLHELLENDQNFAIFGNYVAGISLREMVSHAKKFAKNFGHE
jgi:oxygen-dependent protoporphyrinogen oxidase